MGPACLNVGQAFGELGIDDAALLGRVFVIRGRELRTEADEPPTTLNSICRRS